MDNIIKLRTIKLIHSLIWIFMVAIIFYILYCGIVDQINLLTWIAVGIILMEGVVLLTFKMSCPLTIVARKYSDSTKHNFDIYLPNWLARYNKQIFTAIYLVGIFILMYRLI